MIPARVAGVPRPLRSASSGISSAPAVSMLCRSVSSVKCLGGVVFPSLISAPLTFSSSPEATEGSSCSFSSDFVERFFLTSAFHPSSNTVFPLAENFAPPQSSSITVSAYRCGSPTATHKRLEISCRIASSPLGSSVKLHFCNSLVGMIAWWSVTFLLLMTCFALIGIFLTPSTGKLLKVRWMRSGNIAAISSVR